MNMRVTTFAQAAAGVLALAAAAAAGAAPITIGSLWSSTHAQSGIGQDSDTAYHNAYGTQSVSSSAGQYSASLRRDAQDSGTGALFDFDFDLTRSGATSSASYAYSTMQFTVGPSDMTFALSGLFGLNGAGVSMFDLALYNMDSLDTVFSDRSISRMTANETFTLGTSGDADLFNQTIGGLTGTLRAGQRYSFSFGARIISEATDTGASATGCVSFALGDAQLDTQCGIAAENAAAAASTQTVPEPGSLALAGLGLAWMGTVRRRARGARAAS